MHMTKTTIFYSKESYVVKLETAEESIVLMQSANGEYLKKRAIGSIFIFDQDF